MSETAGEVLSRTILKLGGKKQLGHKWQWRRAVILIEAKLRYWDAKTEVYRGEFSLEGAVCEMINEKDEAYSKLAKLKRPKVPEGVVDIASPAFFSIKPRDSLKTYYFGVPASERALWIGYMNDAKDGMNRFREALRLKRGATASLSSSSASLMGNLQPISGNSLTNSGGITASPSGSISSHDGSISTGSYTSLGPSSGRSYQSTNSINSSNSVRSNTTNSSTGEVRQTTIEGGMMPGTNLAHHSASAPPARQFHIVVSPSSTLTSLTPRPKPLDEDPFGLAQIHNDSPEPADSTNPSLSPPLSPTPTHTSSPDPMSPAMILSPNTTDTMLNSSPLPSTSPTPSGTTVVTFMPQPVIFTNTSSIRDSFVFDSAL
jgi:hypothetical protein